MKARLACLAEIPVIDCRDPASNGLTFSYKQKKRASPSVTALLGHDGHAEQSRLTQYNVSHIICLHFTLRTGWLWMAHYVISHIKRG